MPFKGFTFHLADTNRDTLPAPRAIGLPTGEEVARVPPDKLELIYATDPDVFNGINMYFETIMFNPPHISCSNEKEQRYMDMWERRVRLKRQIVPKICQNALIFGKAFTEIAYARGMAPTSKNNNGNVEMAKLFCRDPKFYDFKRSGMLNRIEYDAYQEPKSYVQYLGWDIPKQPDETMQFGLRVVEIPKDKISLTVFLTLGDSFDGIGLIEPLYNAAVGKSNAEKGFTNSMYRLGHPLLGLGVGSESIFPTKDMIDQAAEGFKEINERNTVAYPYYIQPEVIEAKRGADRLREQIGYYVDEEIAGLGLAGALVTGRGESMNRSILDKLMVLFYQRLSMMQGNISASIEDDVFSKIAEQKGFDSIPTLEWNEISMESLSARAKRVVSYIKAGALKPTLALENLIRRWEELPEITKEEYDSIESLVKTKTVRLSGGTK